jgi:hypothetical protein
LLRYASSRLTTTIHLLWKTVKTLATSSIHFSQQGAQPIPTPSATFSPTVICLPTAVDYCVIAQGVLPFVNNASCVSNQTLACSIAAFISPSSLLAEHRLFAVSWRRVCASSDWKCGVAWTPITAPAWALPCSKVGRFCTRFDYTGSITCHLRRRVQFGPFSQWQLA